MPSRCHYPEPEDLLGERHKVRRTARSSIHMVLSEETGANDRYERSEEAQVCQKDATQASHEAEKLGLNGENLCVNPEKKHCDMV